MNKPLLLSLALAVVTAAPFTTRAEDEKPAAAAPERPARAAAGGAGAANVVERLKNLKEKLGLTDEQSAKVKDIFEKHRGEFAKLREDTDLKPEDKRAKMLELRKAEMAEVREVLTPEQKEKMKEMRPLARPGADTKPAEKPEAK
jgi:Spy/CpxP family protein refolding chaperone